jgi:hypothetical protein
VCGPALKLLSVTSSGKQCGPHVASEPSLNRTLGAGPEGVDDALLGGCVVGGRVEDEGCGAGVREDVGAVGLWLGEGVRDGVADRDRLREADALVDGLVDAEFVAGRDARLDDPVTGGPPGTGNDRSGCVDNVPGSVGPVPASGLLPPPWLSSRTAPTAAMTQTISTSSATPRTDTSLAGLSSDPTPRNAPHSPQTNSSSATRPHRGHVVISRIP